MVTCVAFSVAKPFRLPIWTNKPFCLSILVLVIFNSLLVILKDGNEMSEFFHLLPFTTTDGTSYYNYRAWICIGILLNTLATFTAEKVIIGVVTLKADQRKANLKKLRFREKM